MVRLCSTQGSSPKDKGLESSSRVTGFYSQLFREVNSQRVPKIARKWQHFQDPSPPSAKCPLSGAELYLLQGACHSPRHCTVLHTEQVLTETNVTICCPKTLKVSPLVNPCDQHCTKTWSQFTHPCSEHLSFLCP